MPFLANASYHVKRRDPYGAYRKKYTPDSIQCLKMLSRQYPTIQATGAEIINLQAVLSPPKGTEHFIFDVHGEHEVFLHTLNLCSRGLREKIDEIFKAILQNHDIANAVNFFERFECRA